MGAFDWLTKIWQRKPAEGKTAADLPMRNQVLRRVDAYRRDAPGTQSLADSMDADRRDGLEPLENLMPPYIAEATDEPERRAS